MAAGGGKQGRGPARRRGRGAVRLVVAAAGLAVVGPHVLIEDVP